MNKYTSNKEVELKAEELTEKHGVKVTPFTFHADDDGKDLVVGFLKEPPRIVKMRAMDKVLTAPSSAGAELLEICLIKEESDSRIVSENSEHDSIYMGACNRALAMVKVKQDAFKKS